MLYIIDELNNVFSEIVQLSCKGLYKCHGLVAHKLQGHYYADDSGYISQVSRWPSEHISKEVRYSHVTAIVINNVKLWYLIQWHIYYYYRKIKFRGGGEGTNYD